MAVQRIGAVTHQRRPAALDAARVVHVWRREHGIRSPDMDV